MVGTSNIIDGMNVLRLVLIEPGTTLRAQVGDDIYLPESPGPSLFNGATTKGIVISQRDGRPNGERLGTANLQAKCYGGSAGYDGAKAVARAFVDRIRNAHSTDTAAGRYISGLVESTGQLLTEPETSPAWKYELVFATVRTGPITE